jgi:hypothetical protein
MNLLAGVLPCRHELVMNHYGCWLYDVGWIFVWMTSWLYLLCMVPRIVFTMLVIYVYTEIINLAAMVAKENNDYLEGLVQSRK